MEKILQQILQKLDKIETRMDKIDIRMDNFENRLDRLEPLVVENHRWLRTLVENSEVHRAEMDNINNHVARVEGVLTGFDKSLEPLRKAQ